MYNQNNLQKNVLYKKGKHKFVYSRSQHFFLGLLNQFKVIALLYSPKVTYSIALWKCLSVQVFKKDPAS